LDPGAYFGIAARPADRGPFVGVIAAATAGALIALPVSECTV